MQRTQSIAVDSVPRTTSKSALARYVIAAVLARTADSGAAVAFVLLVTSQGSRFQSPAATAGILTACLTAPHLLGPLIARRVDLAADSRKVIAGACVVYSAAIATAALAVGYAETWMVAAVLAVTGASGPLLTGGFSSRLPALAAPGEKSQRRAQGWDATTYGVGATVGPAGVALLSVAVSPLFAALSLAAIALLAAVMTMWLPVMPPAHGGDREKVPGPLQTMAVIAKTGPLRRTAYLTMIIAMPGAAVPIVAVGMAGVLGVNQATSATLTAVFGLGNLAGALAAMAWPLRGRAEVLVLVLGSGVGFTFAAAAVIPSLLWSAVAFAVAGVLNSLFFAATLAARAEYSPAEVRAQVFIWMAALKVATASAGTAAAGALLGLDPRLPLLLGAGLVFAGVGLALADNFVGKGVSRRRAPELDRNRLFQDADGLRSAAPSTDQITQPEGPEGGTRAKEFRSR